MMAIQSITFISVDLGFHGMTELYPLIEPYDQGILDVGDDGLRNFAPSTTTSRGYEFVHPTDVRHWQSLEPN